MESIAEELERLDLNRRRRSLRRSCR